MGKALIIKDTTFAGGFLMPADFSFSSSLTLLEEKKPGYGINRDTYTPYIKEIKAPGGNFGLNFYKMKTTIGPNMTWTSSDPRISSPDSKFDIWFIDEFLYKYLLNSDAVFGDHSSDYETYDTSDFAKVFKAHLLGEVHSGGYREKPFVRPFIDKIINRQYAITLTGIYNVQNLEGKVNKML